MKKIKLAALMSLAILAGAITFVSCGASGSSKKGKQYIALQQGDRATLTIDSTSANGYTTIVFPESLNSEDETLYDTDLTGYLLKSNAPITTDGGTWGNDRIYYYLHNSKEWLHLGEYEKATDQTVSKIKSIRISNNRLRLREFVNEMPMMANSKEKKNDQGFQDEISFGNSYYIFIDVLMRD